MPRVPRPWRSRSEGGLFLGLAHRLVLRLARPLGWLGVDARITADLVRLRFLATDRNVIPHLGETGVALATIMSVLFGVLAGVVALASQPDAVHWLVGIHGIGTFLLVLLILPKCTQQLFDDTDVQMLAHHPIPSRELFAGRLVQLSVYLFVVCGWFYVGAAPLAVARLPLATLLGLPLVLFLAALFAVASVSFLIAALRLVLGEHGTRRLMRGLQLVGASGVMVMATQCGPTAQAVLETGREAPEWVTELVPSVHLGELLEGELGPRSALGVAVGVVLPMVMLALSIWSARWHFQNGLQGRSGGGRRRPPRRPRIARSWLHALQRLILPTPAQRAGFGLVWHRAWREPHTVAQLLGLLAIPLILAFPRLSLPDGADTASGALGEELGWLRFGFQGSLLLGVFAWTLMKLTLALSSSAYVREPEPAWIFDATAADPDQLLRGGLRALVLVCFLPALLAVGGVSALLAGAGHAPQVAFGVGAVLVLLMRIAADSPLQVPYTRKPPKETTPELKALHRQGLRAARRRLPDLLLALLGFLAVAFLSVPVWAIALVLAPLVVHAWLRLERARVFVPASP